MMIAVSPITKKRKKKRILRILSIFILLLFSWTLSKLDENRWCHWFWDFFYRDSININVCTNVCIEKLISLHQLTFYRRNFENPKSNIRYSLTRRIFYFVHVIDDLMIFVVTSKH
jgi:hypothetical protein